MGDVACFYRNRDFGGIKFCRGINQVATKDDIEKAYLNDEFSSVMVPNRLQVIAYTGDFEGRHRVYTADDSDLGSGDMDDSISSFFVQGECNQHNVMLNVHYLFNVAI